jgi:hypothetical protein
MKTLTIIIALLLPAAALAQGMGASDGHDLDALWARAQQSFDLGREDAVILLDSRTVTVGDEGTLVTRVHEVVWIATSQVIRSYADLRVPWNSADSTFEVHKLRTWSGGRWWPDAERISDTAVVHTLPYAVARAHDYTTLRETMLLHDGVELPCIMETVYTIASQGSPTAGADDLHVIPRRDPTVRFAYTLRTQPGVSVQLRSLNGAPEPVIGDGDVQTAAWTMDLPGALARPLTGHAELYEPALAWSTWESWSALHEHFAAAVAEAATLDGALADSLAAVTAGAPEGMARTEAVAAFVNRSVRAIHTSPAPWRLAPRAASRTFATGYGHALDRAVLAAALLGGEVEPWFAGFDVAAEDLPRLSGIAGYRVDARSFDGSLVFDGGSGKLQNTLAENGRVTPLAAAGAGRRGVLDEAWGLDLAIEPGGDGWIGAGALRAFPAAGLPLAGLDGSDLAAVLGPVLAGVLPGAAITESAPTLVQGGLVQGARFCFTLPDPADDEGRLVIGSPASAPAGELGHDVHLADGERRSPVVLAAPFVQWVTLRIRGGRATAPEAVEVSNAAGSFLVTATDQAGWLVITRRLDIRGRRHEAEAWPQLRALLLEEADPVHGTVVFPADE